MRIISSKNQKIKKKTLLKIVEISIINATNTILDMLFPIKCVNCGMDGKWLCFECSTRISYIKTSTCPSCGKLTKNSEFCRNCKQKYDYKIDGIFTAARYNEGPIKMLIYSLKYDGIRDTAIILAEILKQRMPASILGSQNILITCVPLHRRREKERGFNQSFLVARELSLLINIQNAPTLIKIKNTKSQASLKKAERLVNVIDAYRFQGCHVHDKTILLVDDVTTTNSTLNECAKVLKNRGAKKVYGVVVAKNI